jgi:zinc/manganese transport system permease protein
METVDPTFLASVSRAGAPTQLAFLALVVLNLVAGFNALGTLLAVGLMMLPAACARLWAARLTGIFLVATGVALVSVYIGLVLSWHASAPTGPMIILAAGFFYVISVLFGRAGGILRALPARKHLEA